ncbi:RNA-guided endonuclease InsQ/TnpB family protein [Gloeothece citriformis]|uniref:RNA-guided endonuclease InsQ/TnpB family protein n=1 Tax=Gloeothece citriformis TaxID=2546356 RepID=UPI000173B472|nr:RNA-guided endonuclease TnpB family protein [Gloeothece citriformis]
MYAGHKFRLYPTNEQKEALDKAFGCARWYWNYSLELCQKTFQETGKGLTRNKIQSLLPGLKKEHEWLKRDIYSQCLQVVALNLSTAYKNFFEKRAGLPRFKSRRVKQSISYPQNTKIKQDCIHFPKLGDIYCRFTRKFEGEVKMMTISKTPEQKYLVSILVDDGQDAPPLSSEGKAVGIDVGLLDFCVTSDGSKYNNPKHWNKHFKKLKRRQ